MTQVDVLRAIVAKLGEVAPDAVGPAFSLATPALKGSIKRAALAASIRRELGITCPSAHFVTTFSELEQAVFGQAVAPDAGRAAAPASAPVAVHPTSADRVPVTVPGLVAMRCGVDIETIASLPEATDYREHQFYQDTFAPAEIAYCVAQEDPRMHFAARWCVKEALYKCDPLYRARGMADIELVRKASGDLSLCERVDGHSRPLPHAVSVSHTESLAMAMVVMAPAATERHERPLAPASVPVPSVEVATAASTTGSLPLISALAWLVAMSVSILALMRTLS